VEIAEEEEIGGKGADLAAGLRPEDAVVPRTGRCLERGRTPGTEE